MIDKDIENIRGFIRSIRTDLEEDAPDNFKLAKSIENVLKELGEKTTLLNYANNKISELIPLKNEAYEKYCEMSKELEIYKKIAEKLADELSKHIWLNDKDAILKIYREKVEENETHS